MGGYEPPDIEELHERLRVTVRIPDHNEEIGRASCRERV